MELRAYWTIIWRRIWLVALIVRVVVLYIGYEYYHVGRHPGGLSEYQSTITYQIGLQASAKGTDPSYADNIAVSEALADTLVKGPILTSKEFDTQVSQQVGLDMSTNNIGTFLDYVITNNATHSSSDTNVQPAVSARVISDATNPVKVPGTFTEKAATFAILLLVALIVGIALTFLADYLDDRIYGKEEAADLLQLPIYGELPPAKAQVKSKQRLQSPAA